MSKVRDARQLQAKAAIHRQAVLEAEALGQTDTLNHERADVLDEKAQAMLTPATPPAVVPAGEVVPREGVVKADSNRTIRVPGMAAIEASEQRESLLDKADVLALALDLAEDMQPQDTAQRMTCHGIALAYKMMFTLLAEAEKKTFEISKARTQKLAMNFMREMNFGIANLQKLKTGGKQLVVVQHQHVTVNDGGQAVIGSVTGGQAGAGRTKIEGTP